MKQQEKTLTAAKPITEKTDGAPVYKFRREDVLVPQEGPFLRPELDVNVQAPLTPVGEVVRLKTTLINTVATSLLCNPDFKSSADSTRQNLMKLGEELSRHDPEFLLKTALYTRNDLNIRTTANFILALASNIHSCRPYLRKYYCSSIRLPSDWIEVAEIYQTLHDRSLNFGSLPTALRKVMSVKFVEFDVYQLAKYNKNSSKKNKKEKEKKEVEAKKKGKDDGTPKKADAEMATRDDQEAPPLRSDTNSTVQSSEFGIGDTASDKETEEEVERLSFTLKQLIRKLHISDPAEPVMSLLGKRYPEDSEAFRRSRLPGIFDETRAGTRMKLATPETWETQVSLHGNKAHTWEQLIDHNKLPFMAMLRNLRNLITANIGPKYHRWIWSKLNDERAVVNSRQFPFRFFSAYEVLVELEKISKGEIVPKSKGRGKKPPKPLPNIEISVVQRYRSALDNALKIATCYNVKPISGSTLILCNVGSNMNRPCTAARGLGKPRTVQEVGLLLGLMCKYSCEDCTFLLYGESSHAQVELEEGTILHNMDHVQSVATDHGLTTGNGVIPMKFLYEMLVDRTSVDNIVLLTDTMKLDDAQGKEMMDYLKKYRHLINPNLLFVSVDLSGRSSGVSGTITPEHENDIYLAGYSDQILRFIAERGDTGQLMYIENIDRAYNLKQLPQSALLATEPNARSAFSLGGEMALMDSGQRQKWQTVRVFISSTFRDMHGERDLLTRFVFPELRARAHTKQIQLYEVDLRWGVTEEDARHHKALEICLNEISRCHYFIGLLGERYGWIQNEYEVSDAPEFDWLKEFPSGRSITEIEMQHACLQRPERSIKKSFFYFRDNSVNASIPKTHRGEFESESEEAKEKIELLKSEIRTSGIEVYDGYPSRWLGVLEDKPMVGGLEDFGQRVLHNLWNAIKMDYPEDETIMDPMEEAALAHEAFAEGHAENFVGRKSLLVKAGQMVDSSEQGLLVLTGKPGSGKSAFVAALAQQCSGSLSSNLVLTHFLGAAPSSTNIASILTRLCHEMNRRFDLEREVPDDYTEIVKCWPEFLEESGAATDGSHFVILIDGLDLLEEKHNARALDWLPSRLPSGVVLVVSAVERGQIATSLQKRYPQQSFLTIGTLNEWDKGDMVRQTLARHRKSLDESPFNNQMKLLLSKKDATKPLFLHLACEELRVFGVFEEVSVFLKALPPTLPDLLQEILSRLERELGEEVISTALALLCLVRNGLKEWELSGLISLYFNSKCSQNLPKDVDRILPPMVLSRLLRCLQSFLQPTMNEDCDILALAHKEIEAAVRHRYMRGRGKKEKTYHELLAAYFLSEADPSCDGTYKSNDERAFNELPYHLLLDGQWNKLEEVLCNINFVISKCQLGSAQSLLEDYTPCIEGLPSGQARELSKFVHRPRVQIFRSFVSRNLHVLTATPSLAIQQAINEPSISLVAQEAEKVLRDCPQPLIKQLNRSPRENPCRITLPNHSSEVTCVAVSQDGTQFAAGFKNCSVRLYSVATGRELQSFVGHAAGITAVCFVGSHALCSASHDTNLSLWDLKGGFRRATMTSHTRSVRGCAADTAGRVLVSVSWDTNIRVWNGRTGEPVCYLATKGGRNCPLNCVAFHPTSDQLIAVGSWDNTIKIWDTFNKKRIKVLKGHRTSVQACTYAPTGRHIVSAALDGEVKIWSTKSGGAVGSIVGHCDPVNALAFTPNGQYLMTGSSDRVVKVWSGTLGQQVAEMGGADRGYAHCITYIKTDLTILAGYHDGHVRLFHTQTTAEVYAVKLHEKAIVGVGHQGQFKMSASADGGIKIWEKPSSLPRHFVLEGHKAGITCAVWTRHGLASAAEDFSLFLWPHELNHYSKLWIQAAKSNLNAISIYPLVSLKGHTSTISALSFSNDGLRMASASHDKSVIIWDLLSRKEVRTVRECHNDWITACAFSDTSSDSLITGSNDFNLKLWNLNTGAERITFKGHTSAINCVSFSKGCVVSSSFDGSVKIWTNKGVEITTLYCHKQRVNACVLDVPGSDSHDTSAWADLVEEEEEGAKQERLKLAEVRVITASDDGTVKIWKPFVPNEITALVGHSDRVLAIGATLNNEIVTASRDKSIRIWSPDLPDEVGVVSLMSSGHGHTGEVTAVALSPPYIATAGRDGCVMMWTLTKEDETSRNLTKLYNIAVSEKAVTSLSFVSSSTKGSVTLAAGTDGGSVVEYKFSQTAYPSVTTTLSPSLLMGDHPISGLTTTPNHKYLLASSWSNRAVALSSTRGVLGSLESHSNWVMDLITVKRGKEVFAYTLGLDGVVGKWLLNPLSSGQQPVSSTVYSIPELEGGEKEGREKEGWLQCLCELNPTYVAIGDSEGRVWLWNQQTTKVILTKKVHKSAINGVAAVKGMLVTASDDKTIKIWRLTTTNPVNLIQVGHFHAQSCVTSLSKLPLLPDDKAPPILVGGDSLGQVLLLEWHQ